MLLREGSINPLDRSSATTPFLKDALNNQMITRLPERLLGNTGIHRLNALKQ